MKPQREAIEVTQEAPSGKSKITVVVALAMLLGSLLTVIAFGAFAHYRKTVALEEEILLLEGALKERRSALDAMEAQIKVLSKQIQVLKEHSIARSGASGERSKKVPGSVPEGDSEEGVETLPDSSESKGSSVAPPRAKKTTAAVHNCEVAGKSPQEQAASLKRCVGLADLPSARPRP